jgi:hypothetical protein
MPEANSRETNMNGAFGAVQSHFKTILSLGAQRVLIGCSVIGDDLAANGFGQIGAGRIKGT